MFVFPFLPSFPSFFFLFFFFVFSLHFCNQNEFSSYLLSFFLLFSFLLFPSFFFSSIISCRIKYECIIEWGQVFWCLQNTIITFLIFKMFKILDRKSQEVQIFFGDHSQSLFSFWLTTGRQPSYGCFCSLFCLKLIEPKSPEARYQTVWFIVCIFTVWAKSSACIGLFSSMEANGATIKVETLGCECVP